MHVSSAKSKRNRKLQILAKFDALDHSALFYMVLAIESYANRNVSVKAGFVNYFSKLFADFRKFDLSPKLLENFSVFFCYIVS